MVLSIVRKLGPTKIKRTAKEYYALYRSRRKMTTRLTAKAIRYAINQSDKGKNASWVPPSSESHQGMSERYGLSSWRC